MNVKELSELAHNCFSKRSRFMSLCQDIAEHFYPERADFTILHDAGEHTAEGLSTSYPLMVRRDLGNQIGAMLRPYQKEWFKQATRDDEDGVDNDGKKWMERVSKIQFRAMYDPVSQFTRATKEADHDYATFGQAVISVEMNRRADALLYRCWHLRDVAWMENSDGEFCAVFRRWKPTAMDLLRIFKNNHPGVSQLREKDPYCEVDVLHIVVESELYDANQKTRQPYWSIYYDVTHDHILEATPSADLIYVIPRWQTVSGSQYAYSPATLIALPESRLIQAMTATLLDAGERAASPPMVAVQEAIRGDLALYANGVTWVDAQYDERMGEVLRPVTQDKGTLPIGFDMQRDSRAILAKAFFLDKLNMPERGPEMTAYEVGQRVQQYIRDAMPLFEPMEMSYNGALCERTFDVLFRAGAFGSPLDMPKSLRGRQTQWRFESPLHEAIEQGKGQKFLEAKALIAEAVALDQTAIAMVDAKAALRDVLRGIAVPAKWQRSEADMDQYTQMVKQRMAEQAQLTDMQAGADIAAQTAAARKDMAAVPA